MLSSLRTIDVDDFNTLKVQAFDQYGNVFSSLEGFRFNWFVDEASESPGSLKIVPIKDALVQTSHMQHLLEQRKMMSDICLLKGIKTGKSIVKV